MKRMEMETLREICQPNRLPPQGQSHDFDTEATRNVIQEFQFSHFAAVEKVISNLCLRNIILLI